MLFDKVLLGIWGPIITSVGNLLTTVLVTISDVSAFGYSGPGYEEPYRYFLVLALKTLRCGVSWDVVSLH
jgi:hypothetical protein